MATSAMHRKAHGIVLGIRSRIIALLSSCLGSAEPRGFVVQRRTTVASLIAPRRSPVKVGAWHGEGKVTEEYDFEYLRRSKPSADLPGGFCLLLDQLEP